MTPGEPEINIDVEIQDGIQEPLNKKETVSSKTQKNVRNIRKKQYIIRNSLLTDLYEINHFQTIYNIFLVMFILHIAHTGVNDFIQTNSVRLGFRTIRLGFAKLTNAFQIWIWMQLSTFAVYVGVYIWANKRSEQSVNLLFTRTWDYGFSIAYILHQIAFTVFPVVLTLNHHLAPASSLVVLIEQVRMMMKMYAFVRSTVPRFLHHKSDNEDANLQCPGSFEFLYFMFAPTLIYKDEYPRTNNIRWKVVLWSLAEVGIIVIYSAIILEHFVISHYEKFGTDIFKPQTVILTVFSVMLPGVMMCLLVFYCVLHSWQNAMAELLRFGDKLFYKDWWNSSNYDTYYRTWNIIVHEWLHSYIFKEIYELCNSKLCATLTVFLFSAAFHEYVLVVAFRFFYPVLFILFGIIGVAFLYLTRKLVKKTKVGRIGGNLFIWFGLITGNGIIFTCYSMEYYARLHCPPYSDELSDLLLPRSLVC